MYVGRGLYPPNVHMFVAYISPVRPPCFQKLLLLCRELSILSSSKVTDRAGIPVVSGGPSRDFGGTRSSRPPSDPTLPDLPDPKSTRRIQVPNQKINTFRFRKGSIRRRNRPEPRPTRSPPPRSRDLVSFGSDLFRGPRTPRLVLL